MRVNYPYCVGSTPSGPQLNREEMKSRVVQEDFLSDLKMFYQNHLIMDHFHLIMGVNYPHCVGSSPSGPQLSQKEMKPRVVQEDFLSDLEMFPQNHLIVEHFHLVFVHSGVLIRFIPKFLQLN